MKTKLLTLVLLFVFVTLSTAGATNYIENSSFEALVNNQLAKWSHTGGLPAERTAEEHQSALYSAKKYVNSVAVRDYWSQLFQEEALLPGQPVYARMYFKTTFHPLATANAGILLQFRDSANNVIGQSVTSRTIGGTQANWRKVELSLPQAPANTVKVRLSGFIWAKKGDTISLQGNAYYDTVYLDKIYKTIPLQTTLLNKNFENGVNDWLAPVYSGVPGVPFYGTANPVHLGLYAAYNAVEDMHTFDYFGSLYQEVACAAGKLVSGAVYVKTEFAATEYARAGLEMTFLDQNNRTLAFYTRDVGATPNGWVKITLLKKPAPSGTVKVKFNLYVYNPIDGQSAVGKKAYFDDAALGIVSPP